VSILRYDNLGSQMNDPDLLGDPDLVIVITYVMICILPNDFGWPRPLKN